jgi:hypothetical protein
MATLFGCGVSHVEKTVPKSVDMLGSGVDDARLKVILENPERTSVAIVFLQTSDGSLRAIERLILSTPGAASPVIHADFPLGESSGRAAKVYLGGGERSLIAWNLAAGNIASVVPLNGIITHNPAVSETESSLVAVLEFKNGEVWFLGVNIGP